MSAEDISQLTSLSVEEVHHLLGPQAGDVSGILGLHLQGGQAAAASLEAAERVGELLAMLQVALQEAAVAGATGPEPAAAERRADGKVRLGGAWIGFSGHF